MEDQIADHETNDPECGTAQFAGKDTPQQCEASQPGKMEHREEQSGRESGFACWPMSPADQHHGNIQCHCRDKHEIRQAGKRDQTPSEIGELFGDAPRFSTDGKVLAQDDIC